MALEIEGKIFLILAEESGISSQSQKPWRKQSFVIETEETYPKKVCFTVWNENADALKALKVGDKVEINFRLESREFNEKWYTDAVAWKITKIIKETVSSISSENKNLIYGNTNNTNTNTNQNSTSNIVSNDTKDDFDVNTNENADDLPF